MGREKYSTYRPRYLDVARSIKRVMRADKKAAKKFFGKPLKKVSPDAIELIAFQRMMEEVQEKQAMYGGKLCVDGVVVMEEWAWNNSGRHVYFPVPGMLEELYHARFDVENEPIIFPRQSFTVAVPEGDKVGGMHLPGFMVQTFDRAEKVKMAAAFGNDVYGDPMLIQTDAAAEDGPALFITTRHALGIKRVSTPLVRVQRMLNESDSRSEADVIKDVLGVYDAPGMYKLSEEENAVQFRLIKSVVAMCVYMQSDKCIVEDGYPNELSGDIPLRQPRAHTIGGNHFKGIRGGPRSHYRRWHFRRYPIKKDGTRKQGTVAVRGAFVGPRETPHTVKEVEDVHE